MNYILFYYGEIPDHVELTLNSILSTDKNAQIYFCTNQKYPKKNINNINFNDFEDLEEKKIEFDSLIKNTDRPLQNNPLWSTSLMRIYVLKKIVEELNINEFTHFDTDIIIYKSFEDIQKEYNFSRTKLNITLLDSEHLVFGYSYFPTSQIIKNIHNNFENIFEDYDFYKNKYSKNGFINEMKMMHIIKDEYPEIF